MKITQDVRELAAKQKCKLGFLPRRRGRKGMAEMGERFREKGEKTNLPADELAVSAIRR
jgi:hypothetical protein